MLKLKHTVAGATLSSADVQSHSVNNLIHAWAAVCKRLDLHVKAVAKPLVSF